MEKCTFCVHRVEKGMQPACVNTCPTDALVFGDVDDADTPISAYLREKSSWQLLDEAGTRPSVYYVGGKPPTKDLKEIERPKATV
jgi:molybdopterin-containing oxidoreductase family iron-sulfur binding subunit